MLIKVKYVCLRKSRSLYAFTIVSVVGLGWAHIASNFFSLISEIKRIWIRFTCVSLFHYRISLLFFRFFLLLFASNFSLRSTLVVFASKWNKAKRNSSLFFRFFSLFFAFFHFFSLFFCIIFVSLRFFRIIFAYFTFIFASDFWCFTSKWIMWNQAFFSLPSETKFLLQFQISLPKWKWGRTLA